MEMIFSDLLSETDKLIERLVSSVNNTDVVLNNFDRIYATLFVYSNNEWKKKGFGYLTKNGKFVMWKSDEIIFEYEDIRKRACRVNKPKCIMVVGNSGEKFLLCSKYQNVLDKLIDDKQNQ